MKSVIQKWKVRLEKECLVWKWSVCFDMGRFENKLLVLKMKRLIWKWMIWKKMNYMGLRALPGLYWMCTVLELCIVLATCTVLELCIVLECVLYRNCVLYWTVYWTEIEYWTVDGSNMTTYTVPDTLGPCSLSQGGTGWHRAWSFLPELDWATDGISWYHHTV